MAAVAAIVLLAWAPGSAAVLVEVEIDERADLSVHRSALLEQLRARGEAILDEAETADAWAMHVLSAPGARADAAFVDQAVTNATGRNLFFENDFEQSASMLGAGLNALVEDPSVLAFHPDLARAAFDAGLTLVRAFDALGMAESAERTLETVATLMWGAQPAATEFSPGFIEDYEAVKSLMPTRALAITWSGGEGCGLRINGFVVSVGADDEVRLPQGEQYMVLECEGTRSLVYRLDPRRSAMHFELAFDDAAVFHDGRVVLRPRQPSPAMLQRVAGQLGHVLGEETIYTMAHSPDDGPDGAPVIEISRVEPSGAVRFRAVRIVVGDADTDARMHAAVEYLVSGQTTSGVAVWNDETGWAAPAGVELVASARSAAPWVFGAVGIAAAGAAVFFETRAAESIADVDACADGVGTGECDPDSLPGLRQDARASRAAGNSLWVTAGVAAAVAIVVRVAGGPRRPDAALATPDFALFPDGGGARGHLRWTF